MSMDERRSSSRSAALDEIRDLYAYNRWANRRILGAAERLDEEEFTRDLGSSFPSVRETLAHILSADWVWLCRWRGSSPPGIPDSWDLSSLSRIRQRWQGIEEDRSSFLALLTEESLAGELAYRTSSGQPYRAPLWQLLRHVVNHSTYHRGQITTMLRQLGRDPVSTDLVRFHRETATAAP